MSLDEFVNTRAPGRVCWTCQLKPEILEELNETRSRLPGVGAAVVSRWLQADHGYAETDIHYNSINTHFQRGHHLRGTDGA